MANKNFTDFTLKTPTNADFLVGYNADGSNEFKITINSLVSSYVNNTELNAASSVLLPTSVYRSVSATFATKTDLNAASSVFLPTSVYRAASATFATTTDLNAASSVLLPTSTYRATSGTFLVSDTTNAPTASSISNVILISQINYNNLGVKNPNTLYFIV